MPVQWRSRVRRLQRALGGAVLLPLLLPLPPAAARAGGNDDRAALQAFVATGAITSRRLQQDLVRAPWPPQELRAAVARNYGVRTVALSRYLDTAAGAALLRSQLSWWSTDLAPQLRLAALRAAILADSRDGSISLLGVVQGLPLRFALAEGGAATPQRSACGCPEGCGSSAVAQLAFLIACLQAGATAPPPP